MLDKLISNLVALAAGGDNAEDILSSGFYVLDVTREYTKRGIALKVSAQGSIKDMPTELVDAIVGDGLSDSHGSDGYIFYPVSRVVNGGVVVSIVGVDNAECGEQL